MNRGTQIDTWTGPDWTGSAEFTLDRRYRYELTRVWAASSPVDRPRTMVVIGCNPALASAERQDQTVRRCMYFAAREGCTRLRMVNLYAMVASHPRDLCDMPEPVGGRYADHVLDRNLDTPGAMVVLAWGNLPKPLTWRARWVTAMVGAARLDAKPVTFGLTKAGQPRHPCRLGNTAVLG